MVNTRTDAELAAAVQAAVDAMLPQIREQVREEYRTGAVASGSNPPPVTIHTWLERFNKQKPRSFEKAVAPVDAENWISHMEKIFDVMDCNDAFKTRLAVYKFEGDALAWWKAYKQAKGGDAWVLTLTWAAFKELFFLQFFPRAEQERLKREYHSIRQRASENSTEYMQRFLRLAGFLGQAAGTAEEQAKNFRWGLHKSILDHVMCIQFTDVAQVADAARNLEILRDRDDYDRSERSDKRHKSGDRYHPYSQQGSHRSHGQSDDRQKNDRQGSDRQGGGGNYRNNNNNNYSRDNNRNSGAGRDQRNRGQQSHRSTNSGSQQSRVPSEGYTHPVCTTCGRRHPGECRRAAGTCFKCGQAGHLQRDCKKNTGASSSGHADKKPDASGRVFALTQDQAANTSGTITGALFIFGRAVFVLFDTGATHSVISTKFASCFTMTPILLDHVLCISTPMKDSARITHVYRDLPLQFDDKIRSVNALPLDMCEFDIILGIDWLAAHRATIDCHSRRVIFGDIHAPEFIYHAEPISKAPYRMAPIELKELKDQLQELLERGRSKTFSRLIYDWFTIQLRVKVQGHFKTAFAHVMSHYEFLGYAFWSHECSSCGHFWVNIVLVEGITMDPARLRLHQNGQDRTSVTEVRSFVWNEEREMSCEELKQRWFLAILTLPAGSGGFRFSAMLLRRVWVPSGKANVVANAFGVRKSGMIADIDQQTSFALMDDGILWSGSTKDVPRSQATFWWSGYEARCDTFVSKCLICQQVKIEHQRASGLLQPLEIPVWKWDEISMDFVTGLPRTQRKHDAIWVVVDRLTKSAHFLPIRKDYPVSKLAEMFQQEIVRLHGTPSAIVSDRDPRFTSRFWKGLQKAWGTRLKFSTTFHPETDGHWHASIKCAPFEMLYGRKCRAPICWDQVGERILEGPEMIEVTNEKVAVAREKLKEAQTRQKSYADRHRRALEFQPGEHVFLKVSPTRGVRRFGIKGKLSPRFIGPFEILDRVGEVSYRLALPPQLSHVHNVFHVSLLRGYKYHPLHVVSYPFDQIREDLSYTEEPESILDRQDRVMRNKTIPFVKILWKNHPEREATWETEESMRASYPHFFV
ncbi:putative reverse transcriptase domain-containing protein [Tanacetum coccineum]|uniref:Reverse transcriptase domain-containing protein n=1 Tax=Tanacetum coccineum TaxID=301880 RepID=A0ABQ5F651_9ASTR